MNPVLRAISGPLRGAIFRLGNEEVTVGRQPSNHLCIGDVSVSRQHCAITPGNDRYKIKDLASRNGTFVNGNAIDGCFLSSGDHIRVGDTVFEFEEVLNSLDLPIPVSDRETVATLKIRSLDGESKAGQAEIAQQSFALAAVAKIGNLLSSRNKVDQLGVETLETICGFATAERGALFLARRGKWVIFGWSKHEGCCNANFAIREIVDRSFKEAASVMANLPDNSKCAIAVPLIIRDATCGVIYLERITSPKPFTGSDLRFVTALSSYVAVAVDYSDNLEQLEAENRRMRDEFHIQHEMVGQSTRMQEVYKRIARIAPTDATVLIRGETGTGKELAARAIHENSPRARRTFEAINCALLKGDLLESELFGHEKGSFTGAVAQKRGKLEVANGGTLFLDEVAELPEVPQSMLLRVLQEHAFERLGGTNRIHVDIRIIAATNKDLEDAVRIHKFRSDLYYRLNVVSVNMAPLRERRDDIPLLAHHFLRRMSKKNNRVVTRISREAMAYLEAYDWPGNVREVENAIEHAVVFGWTDQITPEDLPEAILERAPRSAVPTGDYQDAVRDAKRRIVLDALKDSKGDHGKAAELLHIHPNNLYRLMRDLDVRLQVHSRKRG